MYNTHKHKGTCVKKYTANTLCAKEMQLQILTSNMCKEDFFDFMLALNWGLLLTIFLNLFSYTFFSVAL